MANKPYMPLMMGDWIRGTRGMKAEVRGVYISLLIHQYDNGYLPDDLEELRLIDPEIDKVWDKLKSKFQKQNDGNLLNMKLEEVRKYFNKQKENGDKGGRPKNPNNNPNENPDNNPNSNLHNTEHEYDYDIDKGKEGVGEKPNSGKTVFDAEKEVMANEILFEQILMKTKKDEGFAKDELRKFHLWLVEKELYPYNRQQVFAGFEKWLLNAKSFSPNGKQSKYDKSGTHLFDKPNKG